jgi:hypothetical protein
MDKEGRRLTVTAWGRNGGGRVFDLEDPSAPVLTLPHLNAGHAATSPDGRWIATGTAHGAGVKLWDAGTGMEHRHLIRDETNATVRFSPDSRWLVTGTQSGVDAWDVVSGDRVRQIRRAPRRGLPESSFSPDGRLLAFTPGLSEVELIEPATGLPVVRLLGPDASLVTTGRAAFSPDGGRLVVHTSAGAYRVWDLRRLRAALSDLGLDWHLPACGPPPHADVVPLRLEVDLTEYRRHLQAREHWKRGNDRYRSEDWRKAGDEYDQALKCVPEFAQAANDLAWLLADCPEEQFRDSPRAVALARQAVRLEPHRDHWNTLGVACYRAGDWPRAREALETATRQECGNSWDWFFLAMTHWRLGDRDDAHRYYDLAVRWMEKNEPEDGELRRYRAEAEALLTAEDRK